MAYLNSTQLSIIALRVAERNCVIIEHFIANQDRIRSIKAPFIYYVENKKLRDRGALETDMKDSL